MDHESSGKEEIDLSEIAKDILEIHPTRKTLINSLHALIVEFEAHIDAIIKRYKIMSITLLAATGAAIGFSFSHVLKEVQINKLIMASVVALFGIIGVTSIWYLDLQVFHKFWASFFVEEVKMEESHLFLVDVADTNVSLDNLKARLVGDCNWYIFINLILLAASAIIFSFLWHSVLIKLFIYLAYGAAAFIMIKWMFNANKKLIKVVKQMLLLHKD